MMDKGPPGKDSNFLRDIAERKRINGPSASAFGDKRAGPSANAGGSRFEVISTTPRNDSSAAAHGKKQQVAPAAQSSGGAKAHTESKGPGGQDPLNSGNYQQAYKNRQKASQLSIQNDAAKRIQDEANQKAEELRQMTENKTRARDLHNQIQWWKDQKGQGTHDDSAVNGMVESLQAQLNGIPPKDWY